MKANEAPRIGKVHYHTARRNDYKHHVLRIFAYLGFVHRFWQEYKAVNVKV